MTPEEIARKVIKITYNRKAGIFWTGGKDSTVLLHLIKDLYHKAKNPVIFLDSGIEFQEIYEFVDKIKAVWNLNLHTFSYKAKTADKARLNKIKAINEAIKKLKLEQAYIGIRGDECKARSEATFLELKNDCFRVHPLLAFTEKNIWDYIWENDVPYCDLYDKGYRSLGEEPFTEKSLESERSGREQEKEEVMQQLRELGYF